MKFLNPAVLFLLVSFQVSSGANFESKEFLQDLNEYWPTGNSCTAYNQLGNACCQVSCAWDQSAICQNGYTTTGCHGTSCECKK